ncbi:MAG: hypothetical protein ABIW84_03410, partial [Ilumatobacteraceae bacterium]
MTPAEEDPPTARPAPGQRLGPAVRHFAEYLATLFALVVLTFTLPRLMPGDPIDALVAQSSQNFSFGDQTRVNLENY